MMRQAILTVMAIAMATPTAWAVDFGTVSQTDPRVRYYDYHPEEVYSLTGYYGYVTPVFFRDDEKIQVATIGDSEAWQATPSEARDMILLKPVRADAQTNLVVITDRRTYAFDLGSKEATENAVPVYKVRFRYDGPRTATERELEEAARREREAESRYESEQARLKAEAEARQREAEADAERRAALRDQRRASSSIILDETGGKEGDGERLTPEVRGPRDFDNTPDTYYDPNTGTYREYPVAPAGIPGLQLGAALPPSLNETAGQSGAINAAFRDGRGGVYSDDRRFLDADPDAGLVASVQAEQIQRLDTKILQGALMSGVLETAINSDLTGQIRAVVSEPVWSADGSTILVPIGSRLVGTYRSSVNFGQTRVLILWNRVITPTGVSVVITSPGTDRLGRAGLGGDVDTKFAQRFGAAALISVIGGGTEVLVGRLDGDIDGDTSEDVGDNISSSTAAILRPYANLRPTIHVDQGARINVFVRRDLDFSAVAG